MSQCLIYVTTETEDEAKSIARALVGERLAACANILGTITSVFWWEGEVQDDSEVSLILKTRKDLVERVAERIEALHSYDCPCVVALPIEAGNLAFLSWIDEETAGA